MPTAQRRPRSFVCGDDLWQKLEARAAALECSVDWLLGEAVKRVLETTPDLPEPAAARPSRSDLPPLGPPPRLTPPPPPPRDARPVRARPTPSLPPARKLTLTCQGTATRVDRDAFVIGRSAREAQLVLRDPGVSRQHAIVERQGAIHVITDMASANGVIVNGRRVARHVLCAGDVVEIGPFSLVVT